MLVLDASVSMGWCFRDERSRSVMEIMQLVVETGAVVPSVWRPEMANAMLAGIRRGRMSLPERDRLMAELAALDIEVDAESDRHVWPASSHLADTYGLAIYDACYLELAIRRGLPLAVSDGRLREAAVRHRIPVLP